MMLIYGTYRCVVSKGFCLSDTAQHCSLFNSRRFHCIWAYVTLILFGFFEYRYRTHQADDMDMSVRAFEFHVEKVLPRNNGITTVLLRGTVPLFRLPDILQTRLGKFFCNRILFAICTSTFSKLCKNMYTVACRRVLSSCPL
jgi:hypothetical protein